MFEEITHNKFSFYYLNAQTVNTILLQYYYNNKLKLQFVQGRWQIY